MWAEVTSQRNKRVVWQSRSTRLQHTMSLGPPGEDLKTEPIEWVAGDEVSEVPGTSDLSAFDWSAPGSLIRP